MDKTNIDYEKVMITVLDKIIEDEWRKGKCFHNQLSIKYTFDEFLIDKGWKKPEL